MEVVDDHDAMDVQHPVTDDLEVKPPPAKMAKIAFKDCRLNTKNLFTSFTDEEMTGALLGEQEEITNGNDVGNNNGDPLLAFSLFAVERKYSEEDVQIARKLLKKSWDKNPEQTFKLIKKIRDWKKGKGIRQLYHICLYWLYQYHPSFLYAEFGSLFSNTGYYKDSLEFLMTIAFDGFVPHFLGEDDLGGIPDYLLRNRKSKILQETNIYNIRVLQYLQLPPNEPVNSEKRIKFAREKFEKDLKYRIFHVKVAKFFAKGLLEDKDKVETLQPVSYFAKWAPTIEKHHDKYTLISTTIACELLQLAGEQYFDVWTKSLPVAVYLARKIYNNEFCVPLRANSEIAEVAMSAKEWDQVNYKNVPSKSMTRNARSFDRNDSERFEEYLKSSMKRTQELKPLEIIDRVMSITLDDSLNYRKLLQKQWKELTSDIRYSGPLKNNISVICLKSESDPGKRMLKSALGLMLLTADINKSKSNYFITLNETELNFNKIQTSLSIFEQVGKLKKIDWSGTGKLFDILNKILQGGTEKKLKKDEMMQQVYFFVDDDFNSIFPNATEDIERAKVLFQSRSYKFPVLVFWNLSSTESHKVYSNDKDVCLLSGFGTGQMKHLMSPRGVANMTPLELLHFSFI